MLSHTITMSDHELQLLEKARLHLGLPSIEQTVETLARSALSGVGKQDCDGPSGQSSGAGADQS
jgi:hypothetical protein